MPFKSSSIKLSDTQDRRRKLTDQQKTEIAALYEKGGCSWKSLADKYGVSKRTIGIIVSERAKNTIKKYNKEHWREHQQKGEDWAKVIREHRRYKQELYLKGDLRPNQNES